MSESPAANSKRPRVAAPAVDPEPPAPPPNLSGLDGLLRTVTAPLAVAAKAVPAGPVPVALAAGALAVVGVIEWPLAAALGLGYLALRRWR